MKATVNPDSLLKELKKMSLVVNKTVVIPILSSVLFSFEKGKLTITATDLETTYISTIDCECSQVFKVVIECSDILDVCSKVSQPMQFEVEDKTIKITSGSAKFKFSAVDNAEVFPNTLEEEYFIDLNVDGTFYYYLLNANTCRNKDLAKVNYNMAAIDISKNELCVVATDANMLYKKTLPIKNKKELTVMVCDKFVQSCKLFQESKISIGEKFIKAVNKNETVISRLAENKFVNYKAVLPSEIEYNLKIKKDVLRQSLLTISVASSLLDKQCVFHFNGGTIKFTSQNIDFEKSAETEIETDHSVPIEAIALNGSLLVHLLSIIEVEEIELSFTDPHKTIFIKPVNDDSLLLLLQPLMITI